MRLLTAVLALPLALTLGCGTQLEPTGKQEGGDRAQVDKTSPTQEESERTANAESSTEDNTASAETREGDVPPKRMVARVPLDQLNSEDMDDAEFVPLNEKVEGSDRQTAETYRQAFEEAELDSDDIKGRFVLAKAGEDIPPEPESDQGLGLCGSCGGGILARIGRVVGGVLRGVGHVVLGTVRGAAHAVRGVAGALVQYRPVYYGRGARCGYIEKGHFDYRGYRYFPYERDPDFVPKHGPNQGPPPPVKGPGKGCGPDSPDCGYEPIPRPCDGNCTPQPEPQPQPGPGPGPCGPDGSKCKKAQ